MANTFFKENIDVKILLNNISVGKKIAILSVILTIVAVLLIGVNCNKKISLEAGEFDKTSMETYEVDMLAANDNDVEITYNNAKSTEQKPVRTTVSVEDTGRSDPFLPDEEFVIIEPMQARSKSKPKPSYDLLPPPETITSDATATEVMTTRVSGLMYDKSNPSAIININNSDYLVRKGDVVNDYKVLDITKNTVTVKYGSNVYKAGVGELFTGEGINYNTISNLENKFGGANNSVNKR